LWPCQLDRNLTGAGQKRQRWIGTRATHQVEDGRKTESLSLRADPMERERGQLTSGVQRGRGRGAICRARMRRRRRIGVDPWRGIIDTARILGSSHGRGIGVSLALGGLYGKGVGCHLPSCVRPALSPPCLGG
jgi:hypothetical protein